MTATIAEPAAGAMPPAALAGYSDYELSRFYLATADDTSPDLESWRRAIEAELERRDAADHARHMTDSTTSQTRAGQRFTHSVIQPVQSAPESRLSGPVRPADPVAAEWFDMAHAQFLAAESACNGFLVRGPFHDYREDADAPGKCEECGRLFRHPKHTGVDAFVLWAGPDEWARSHATDELRAFWDASPRVPVTEYQRQARAGRVAERSSYYDRTVGPDDSGQVRSQAARGAGSVRADNRVRSGRQQVGRSYGDYGPVRAAGRHKRPGRAAGLAVSPAIAALRQRADAYRQAGSGEVKTGTVVPRERGTVAIPDIDGSQLLRDTRKFLRHFALWPSEAALNCATLFVAACHARDASGEPVWEYCSRLLITASEYGAGKSWLAKLCASLCPSPRVLLEPTKPSLIDLIADHRTIVVTELEELFATPGRNRGLIAVLNASYEPGHYHSRKSGGITQEIHLFAPLILDGLDKVLSGTRGDMRGLVSRCIVLRARMAPDGYRRPRWDKTAQALAQRGRDRLAAWVGQQVAAGLADDMPAVPAEVGNPRRCTLWEPLFALAARADQGNPEGYWTTMALEAAIALESSLSVDLADDDEAAALDDELASWDDGDDVSADWQVA